MRDSWVRVGVSALAVAAMVGAPTLVGPAAGSSSLSAVNASPAAAGVEDAASVATARVGGANRIETAALISQRAYPEPLAGDGSVYLARSDVFADALAAGTLMDGPVLLVPSCRGVPSVVREEIRRLDPGRVVALGGPQAVCAATLTTAGEGRATVRLAGENRYETSAKIAAERAKQGPVSQVYVANGGDSPDAVAGGSLTAGPILLVKDTGGSSADVAAGVVADLKPKQVVALGGRVAVPQSVVDRVAGSVPSNRLAGENRYGTAAAVADFQFSEVTPVVYLARGDVFADAIAAGSLSDGPVLLTRSCALPAETSAALARLRPATVVALGGTTAVCDKALTQAAAAVPIEENAGVVPEANVEILSDEEEGAITAYDPSSGKITTSDAAASMATISTGDVIVAGPSDAAPEGLLRKVTSVDPTANGYSIATTQATVADAISTTNGPVTVTGEVLSVESEAVTGVTVTTPGAAPPTTGLRSPDSARSATAASASRTFTFAEEWSAAAGDDELNGSGTLSLEGSLTVAATADLVFDAGFTGVNKVRLTVSPSADATLTGTASGQLGGTVDKQVGSVTRVWRFMVGPVPVIVTDTASIQLEATAQASGQATVKAGVHADATTGFLYDNDSFSLISDTNGSVDAPTFDASANISAQVSAATKETIKAYGVAGASAAIGPYVSGSAQFTSAGDTCSLSSGITGDLGVEAGIDIWGFTLADWERSTSLTEDWYNESGPCTDMPGWGGDDPGPGEVAITTNTLPTGTTGEPYAATLAATGGSLPYTWSVTRGALPAGLSLNAATGKITGTPTAQGTSTITLTAKDSTGASATAVVELVIKDAQALNPTTERVSVASDGTQTNGGSHSSDTSADGRFIVYESYASNLVSGDTNGLYDVFVHDRESGETTRVSVASNGAQADGESAYPSISADGRFVAYSSNASTLVAGDTNRQMDAFVHDRATGETARVSVASNGTQANYASWSPSISADGRFVAYHSDADNLVLGDANGYQDVFVYDRSSGKTTRVSVASNGTQANYASWFPRISADGRFVAYYSDADNLVPGDTNGKVDVFVHDRISGKTTRVSVASDGTQANNGSNSQSISADGRFVAYSSNASNLVSGDTNDRWDAFVHDRDTGNTIRVSTALDGAQSTSNAYSASISADGNFVAYHLAPYVTDVYVHDRSSGEITRVSTASDGAQSNGFSASPSISADGRFVAYHSDADDLVSGDTNGFNDVFVTEWRP